MKVLHLWLSDSPQVGGGGAGSMFRLHTTMRAAGVDSAILCEAKTSQDPHIYTKPGLTRGEALLGKVTSRLGLNDIHRYSSFRLHQHPVWQEADIINLHGLLGGFINYLALPTLTATKPTVLTLRSMWCLTGHCGVPLDCQRWKTGCGQCPYPDVYPPVKRDATHLDWKLKRWAFGRSKLHLVALSQWLTDQVGQSHLHHLPISTIPNGVDSEQFQPLDKRACREVLGLKTQYVLMFMAVSIKARHKGGDLLTRTLQQLPPAIKKDTTLLLLGNNPGTIGEDTGIQTLHLGYVAHHRLKAMAYSSADFFLMPSRSEAFGQVILESLACGTPVAAFEVGPMPELVRPGETGCLAAPEDAEGLARHIGQLLENPNEMRRLQQRCREVAVNEYGLSREVDSYLHLYQTLLEGQP